MKKQNSKKTSRNNKYFLEVGILAALLAGALGFSYYSDFVSTGYAVTRVQGIAPALSLPSWATWAGVPWSLFTSNAIADIVENETLIRAVPDPARFNEDNKDVNFNITAQGDYVWKTGWLYNGTRWVSFNFTPNEKSGGSGQYYSSGWITNASIATVNGQNNSNLNRLMPGGYWFVAYTCQYVNSQWKCGCRTTTNCGKWQLQNFVVNSSSNLNVNTNLFDDYLNAPPAERPLLAEQIAGGQPVNVPNVLPSQADFNGDRVVNFNDFFLFADFFGLTVVENPDLQKFDLDGDFTVDLDDFFGFAAHISKTIVVLQPGGSVMIATDKFYNLNVTLVGVSSETAAAVKVGSEQKTATKGATTTIGGVDIFIEDITYLPSAEPPKLAAKLVFVGTKI